MQQVLLKTAKKRVYIYTWQYLEPKGFALLTVHTGNYHLARHMWVCEQQSSCLLSDSSHSTFENLDVFIRSECSSASSIKVKTCLSEATGRLQSKGNLGCLLRDSIPENTACLGVQIFLTIQIYCLRAGRLIEQEINLWPSHSGYCMGYN